VKLWVDVPTAASLVRVLNASFGVESSHVAGDRLREADDADVFAALRREGEVVFTKMRLHRYRDAPRAPPQVLWLRVGNCGMMIFGRS